MYCVPTEATVTPTNGAADILTFKPGSSSDTAVTPELKLFGNSVTRPVRFSSMIVSSASPFKVVVQASWGDVTYQVAGQKPTKIVFSRETSIVGNPATLESKYNGLVVSRSPAVSSWIKIIGAENPVDVRIMLVRN